MILLIETATEVCSVCLEDKGTALAVQESNEGYNHAEKLTIMIEQVLKSQNVSFKDLEAVAVSKGPGSYTGLRIGVSVAKGLCYALEIPLIGISTLKSIANICLHFDFLPGWHVVTKMFDKQDQNNWLICPMIDARRMEVYCAVYDQQLKELLPVDARIITEDSFKDLLSERKIIFLGSGAAKCKPLIGNNPNASFIDLGASAAGMVTLAEEKFLKKEFEDVSLFEPFYLKEASIGKHAK